MSDKTVNVGQNRNKWIIDFQRKKNVTTDNCKEYDVRINKKRWSFKQEREGNLHLRMERDG